MNEEKCVFIVDESLPIGLLANVTAIIGMTLGKMIPEIIGQDVYDRNGYKHLGITQIPVPILKGNHAIIKDILQCSSQEEDVKIVDFTVLAQGCRTYEEYISKMKETDTNNLQYIGLAIFGKKKIVNKLTGNLSLLR